MRLDSWDLLCISMYNQNFHGTVTSRLGQKLQCLSQQLQIICKRPTRRYRKGQFVEKEIAESDLYNVKYHREVGAC
jgi:hypothetical protein